MITTKIRSMELHYDEIKRRAEVLRYIENGLIEKYHPLRTGEKVTVNSYDNLCSIVGSKKIFIVEKRGFVRKIPWRSNPEYFFTASGPILKKDGSPGLRDGNWSVKITL